MAEVAAELPLSAGADQAEQAPAQPAAANPNKKRKFAVFLGYLGAGYHGMQRNPPYPTIEAELESAMHKAGAISEANASSFSKIHWMRAARTDKGVSAACQVVSAKLVMETPGMLERINEHLPAQIQVYGHHRCIDGFDARKFCDRRRYEYVLPAWVLDPEIGLSPAERERRKQRLEKQALRQQQREQEGDQQPPQQQQEQHLAEPDLEFPVVNRGADNAKDVTAETLHLPQDRLRMLRKEVASSSYVFDEAERARLNSILASYVGTHNFHNFSVRVDPFRNEARRYMLSFECPGIIDIQGQPWVKMVVLGQSFILHQIRKMVGLAVVTHRGQVPMSAIRLALDADRDYNVPMAPELGLFLDETFYDGYNQRWAAIHGALSFEPFRAQAEAFKAERIYPHIASTDAKDMINAIWLHNLTDAQYRFSTWTQNPKIRNVRGKKRSLQQPQRAPHAAPALPQQQQQQQQEEDQGACLVQRLRDDASTAKRQRTEGPAASAEPVTGTGPGSTSAAPLAAAVAAHTSGAGSSLNHEPGEGGAGTSAQGQALATSSAAPDAGPRAATAAEPQAASMAAPTAGPEPGQGQAKEEVSAGAKADPPSAEVVQQQIDSLYDSDLYD